MKIFICFIFCSCVFWSCNNNPNTKPGASSTENTPQKDSTDSVLDPAFKMHQDIDTFYLGDMNGDGRKDTAIVYSPIHAFPTPGGSNESGCADDSCLTQVKFSFTPIVLKHTQALGFQTFFTTGDLNSDGISEVAFIPSWFQSCWQGLFVYSLTENSWKKIGLGSVNACAEEDFSLRVSKVDNNSFRILSSTWDDAIGDNVDTSIVIKW